MAVIAYTNTVHYAWRVRRRVDLTQ